MSKCRQYQKPQCTLPPLICRQNTVRFGAKGPSGAPPKHSKYIEWQQLLKSPTCGVASPITPARLFSSIHHHPTKAGKYVPGKSKVLISNKAKPLWQTLAHCLKKRYLHSPCESDDKENVKANIPAEEPNYSINEMSKKHWIGKTLDQMNFLNLFRVRLPIWAKKINRWMVENLFTDCYLLDYLIQPDCAEVYCCVKAWSLYCEAKYIK